MAQLPRISLDDHVPPTVPDRHAVLEKLRTHSTIQAVAAALDQIHNRSREDLMVRGSLGPDTVANNRSDLAQADLKVRELAAAVEAARSMVAAARDQLAGLGGVASPAPPASGFRPTFGYFSTGSTDRPMNAAGDVSSMVHQWVDHAPPASEPRPPKDTGIPPEAPGGPGEPDPAVQVVPPSTSVQPEHVAETLPTAATPPPDLADRPAEPEVAGGPVQEVIDPNVSDASIRERDRAESEAMNPDSDIKMGRKRR